MKLSVTADLRIVDLRGFGEVVTAIGNIYQICREVEFAHEPGGDLVAARVHMASPAEIAAVSTASQALETAKKAAGLVETCATLPSRRTIAKAEAEVAKRTVAARIAQEDAAARQKLAEANLAETEAQRGRLAYYRDMITLATDLDDPEMKERFRDAMRRELDLRPADPRVEGGAAQLAIIARQTLAIEASASEVPAEE